MNDMQAAVQDLPVQYTTAATSNGQCMWVRTQQSQRNMPVGGNTTDTAGHGATNSQCRSTQLNRRGAAARATAASDWATPLQRPCGTCVAVMQGGQWAQFINATNMPSPHAWVG